MRRKKPTSKNDIEYWRLEIRNQAEHNGSRDIIGVALFHIFQHWGLGEKNRAIRDFKLYRYGYDEKKEETHE